MTPQIVHRSNRLEIDYYPDAKQLHARYIGLLDGQLSSDTYAAFFAFFDTHGLESVKAITLDFRQVTKFHQTNLSATRRESRTANTHYDLSRIPVALLVMNHTQEQFVKVSSKITGTETRVRIVWSEEEAAAFFDEFHFSNSEEETPD